MKLFDKLFNSNSNQDLIAWFEKTSGVKYPNDVREVLSAIIVAPEFVDVKFEASNFGEFQILDFKKLQRAKDGQTSSGWEENMSNPFFVRKQIIDFISSYVPDDHPLHSIDILPFARSTYGDRTSYVYFQNNQESPIRLNIDNVDARPRKIGITINDLIIAGELLAGVKNAKTSFKYNLKKGYKDLIERSRILVTDGERVDDVQGYQRLIEDFCDITKGDLILNRFVGRETDGRRKLSVTINASDIALDLEGNTDWVDLKVIDQLNNALKRMGYGRRFIQFRDSRFGQEFGIVWGDDADFELLKMHGYTGKFWD